MRGENEPDAGDRGDADGAAFAEAHVEPIQRGERDTPGPIVSAPAPGWPRRHSVRGKASRALIIALAVIVALAVLLPRPTFTVPPQITRLLTPVPPAFTTGAFEPVPRPVVPGTRLSFFTPSPRDPATAYVCASPDGGGPVASGVIALWGTHDAGHTWSRVALPDIIGTYCEVYAAADGSHRVVMSAHNFALDQNAPARAHSQFFLSDDDGATWHAIVPTSLTPSGSHIDVGFFALVTARHLFMTASANDATTTGADVPILVRSDDGGQTWQRADNGLPDSAVGYLQLLDATGETLVAFDTGNSSGPPIATGVWISPDAGASWRRVESARLPMPPRGSDLIPAFLTEAPLGELASAPHTCHCVVGLSLPSDLNGDITSAFNMGVHLYVSRDLTQLARWTPLPPLPVEGTSAVRSGVYQVLGLTGDGRVLVLGADPEQGLPKNPGAVKAGQSGPRTRLWAWNTHTGRWELASTNVPCQFSQRCSFNGSSPLAVSVRRDASGRPAATALWVLLG
ncbi:MAG TPA: sialidase family protein, partial [Ktedonobacterales bacterium]|nr:sialidase family protein [Ktedonobacterales bacterium]